MRRSRPATMFRAAVAILALGTRALPARMTTQGVRDVPGHDGGAHVGRVSAYLLVGRVRAVGPIGRHGSCRLTRLLQPIRASHRCAANDGSLQ